MLATTDPAKTALFREKATLLKFFGDYGSLKMLPASDYYY